MSTRIGEALRDLGDEVDGLEADGWTVAGFDPAAGDVTSGGTVGLDLRLVRPFAAGTGGGEVDLEVEGCSIEADGSLVLDLVASRPIEEAPTQPSLSRGQPEGSTDPSDSTSPGEADEPADDGDDPTLASRDASDEPESVPAYRDPERLRAVYEAHDSFPAMTDALDVDVTPQTVRRHMIEHGIHEPRAGADAGDGDDGGATSRADESSGIGGSGESGGDDDGGSVAAADEASVGEDVEGPERTVERPDRADDGQHRSPGGEEADAAPGATEDDPDEADDVDDAPADDEDERRAPGRADGGRSREASVAAELAGVDGVTDEELKAAVRESRTIHELGRRLGVPRERAFRILNALDLIDLVSGRLETEGRSIPAEELDQRIARATAAGE